LKVAHEIEFGWDPPATRQTSFEDRLDCTAKRVLDWRGPEPMSAKVTTGAADVVRTHKVSDRAAVPEGKMERSGVESCVPLERRRADASLPKRSAV
jgi:hypothetical protein